MKYFASTLLLAASVIALPGQFAERGTYGDVLKRDPQRAQDDVNIFCAAEQKASEQAAAKAMKLKRDAEASMDAAEVAAAVYRRSELVRRQQQADDINVFCGDSAAAAETASAKAKMTKREADAASIAALEANSNYANALKRSPQKASDDVNIFCAADRELAEQSSEKAKMLKREADAAAEAETEAHAVYAMALRVRAETAAEDDVNIFCSANKKRAEDAANEALKLKRDAEAAADAASEAEAVYVKALQARSNL